MDSEKFIVWYVSKLRQLLLDKDKDKVENAKIFVLDAIEKLKKISKNDLIIIHRSFSNSHKSRLLGDLNISDGDRDECDLLEEINGTIEFFLEDSLK